MSSTRRSAAPRHPLRFWRSTNLTFVAGLALGVLCLLVGLDQGANAGVAAACVTVPMPFSGYFSGLVSGFARADPADKRKMRENLLKTIVLMILSITLGYFSLQTKPDQPVYLAIAAVGAIPIWTCLIENFSMWRQYRWPEATEEGSPAAVHTLGIDAAAEPADQPDS
ncbi:hypothetical protein ACWEKJ_10505 [Amycolatopsis thermoflava]